MGCRVGGSDGGMSQGGHAGEITLKLEERFILTNILPKT